jgi:hypothetical protein
MSEEKTIKQEMEEQQLTVTINLTNFNYSVSKPINTATLRSHLRTFVEILFFNDVMNTVEANFMKKMGIKGKGH